VLDPSDLVIVPLGGLGEVGMNCLVLEQHVVGGARERIAIDCGVRFPFDDYGVERFHPRFDHLLAADHEAAPPLAGVVLTHGHEDHVGALPELVRALARPTPLPVWGPPYALRVAARRLDEHGLAASVTLNALAAGESTRVGSFGVEAVRVTHSIPDALALAIDTVVGRVIHTGDFKLDAQPLDDAPPDERRLAELGDAGVALLLSDSTNALQGGSAGSERSVAEALSRAIAAASGRVVVGIFASNVYRLAAVADAARASGRHLCLLGRSVRSHAEVARELGIVRWPSDLVVSPEAAAGLAREHVVYVAGGTQGEERGALRRLASGLVPEVRLARGDTVIFSSRVIPGNERAVLGMMNDLVARGVTLASRFTDAELHVSGHAHADELRRMIELTRPRTFVPVHGSRLQLERHGAIAREVGVAEVLLLADGDAARLHATGIERLPQVVAGTVATAAGHALDDDVLQMRKRLGRGGVVFVAIGAGRDSVSVRAHGLPRADEVIRHAEGAARAALGEPDAPDPTVAERVRQAVRRRLEKLLGRRPPVDVCLMDA
jgi:ribonuclease J